jgi:hypothetical protein
VGGDRTNAQMEEPAVKLSAGGGSAAGRLESMAIGEARRAMPLRKRPVWISAAD